MFPAHPIGIFDSGIGGLTVYRALRDALPHENFVYLGDIAHLPYGDKSKETVEQYSVNAAFFLREQSIKLLVTACSTVSAQALDALTQALPGVPICGVIATGAEAAVKATPNGRIAVLATEGTVRSDAFAKMIRNLQRDVEVQMLPCPLLVGLAEGGWHDNPEAEVIVGQYLESLKPGYDTLLLGCTHFPMLTPLFRKLCPPHVQIVDCAAVTAQIVVELLKAQHLEAPAEQTSADIFCVTAEPHRFARVGSLFLGKDIVNNIKVVTLDNIQCDTSISNGR